MTSILVTGGTGTLGRLLVPRLRDAGHDVRILARSTGADLSTGHGVDVDGAEVIVHLAGSAKGDGAKAANLVRAATRARHLVFISVVGADRVPVRSRIDRAMFGYYAEKRAAEEAIAGSGIPFTTLRATQFHELILLTANQLAKLPVMPAPGLRFQPV